jgi:6-phosphofructokinase 1
LTSRFLSQAFYARPRRRGSPESVLLHWICTLLPSPTVIPKTIDNNVPLLDRTFGFETTVDAARDAIEVANVEAEGFPNGLGVVKVMGRNSGFIAMHAALGSCVADLVLVPEVDFFLDGTGGIVDHLFERISVNGKAVVVVAEGVT